MCIICDIDKLENPWQDFWWIIFYIGPTTGHLFMYYYFFYALCLTPGNRLPVLGPYDCGAFVPTLDMIDALLVSSRASFHVLVTHNF